LILLLGRAYKKGLASKRVWQLRRKMKLLTVVTLVGIMKRPAQ